MITIEVTENDIIKAMKNPRYNPVQISLSRSLNVPLNNIDIKNNKIYVWSNDDSDSDKYYIDDSKALNHFIEEWLFYEEHGVDFVEKPFSFIIERKKTCFMN